MWASASEMQQLRDAFAQWTVDGYALGYWLLPLFGLMGLLGGYAFLRKAAPPAFAIAVTLLMAAACAALVWQGGLIAQGYQGRGVLSSRIVAILPWLDGALGAASFLLLACLYWTARSVYKSRRVRALKITGSLTLIHGGAVLALVGGFAATALNTYQAIQIDAEKLQSWSRLPNGMAVRVSLASPALEYSGYRAVAQVEVRAEGDVATGHALFLDGRRQPPGYQGPVRQLCEILDYRYARYTGGPHYLLDPFVTHGLLEDRQVWVPASASLMQQSSSDGSEAPTLIVMRSYPLVSLVWLGLWCMVAGGLLAQNRRGGVNR